MCLFVALYGRIVAATYMVIVLQFVAECLSLNVFSLLEEWMRKLISGSKKKT